METSQWSLLRLTPSGSDSILNMAFYNADASANSTLTLKVGVFQ